MLSGSSAIRTQVERSGYCERSLRVTRPESYQFPERRLANSGMTESIGPMVNSKSSYGLAALAAPPRRVSTGDAGSFDGWDVRPRILHALQLGSPHPSGLNLRTIEAGQSVSFSAGRIGRGTRFPPQFGQLPWSWVSAQSRQKVHSKLQIIASADKGSRSLSAFTIGAQFEHRSTSLSRGLVDCPDLSANWTPL